MVKPRRKRKNSKKQKELWLGIGAVTAALAVVALICFAFAGKPGGTVQDITTGPTYPPLEQNIYGPEDFGYEGDYLTCLAGESILGIDVSSHQGTIDWEQVAQAGIQFVFVRLGYRGYESGALMTDPNAVENLNGARAAGLRVGAYFYSQAMSVEEAEQEAAYALEILGDQALDLPLVYDWEYVSQSARTGNYDSRTLTDCTVAFCEAVEAAGCEPMVYFNTHLAREGFLLEELAEYPFWLAMYDTGMDFPYRVDMWQYTQHGTVPGIEGNVDINLYLP